MFGSNYNNLHSNYNVFHVYCNYAIILTMIHIIIKYDVFHIYSNYVIMITIIYIIVIVIMLSY